MQRPDDRQALVEQALRFARDHLGPESERCVADAGAQALILSRLREGTELEDAVLAVVHTKTADDQGLANEFLAYFLSDLLHIGHSLISARLRSYLDSSDLAQSVLGDFWPELTRVRFEGRSRFLALLGKRLSWKAANHARSLGRQKRGAELRSALAPEDLELPDDAPGPERIAHLREDRERMILALARLSPRDRSLLAAHLRGEDTGTIALRAGLSRAAAEKALTRAKRRARRMIAHDRSALSRSSSAAGE